MSEIKRQLTHHAAFLKLLDEKEAELAQLRENGSTLRNESVYTTAHVTWAWDGADQGSKFEEELSVALVDLRSALEVRKIDLDHALAELVAAVDDKAGKKGEKQLNTRKIPLKFIKTINKAIKSH